MMKGTKQLILHLKVLKTAVNSTLSQETGAGLREEAVQVLDYWILSKQGSFSEQTKICHWVNNLHGYFSEVPVTLKQ